jgi:two-component system OmpR family sensor kinase
VTLRARLTIGLVLLAAVGLAIAGAITYRQQHDFLIQRFDQQLDAAVPRLEFGLDSIARNGPQDVFCPTSCVAELRTAAGTVRIATQDAPKLPANLVAGQTFTTRSPHFRGEAITNREGNLVVVALSLREVDQSLHHLLVLEALVALGVLMALAGLAWWVVKLGLRPLEQMQATARAIAAGDLSQRVEIADERTEAGQLGLAFNEMLHQIQTAFDERAASEAQLRRFVGDASHELRTPLTSIRGYAELFRRGAAERPEDLAKAMRRIEEEANRMGIMVDDLLLLARLDQGRPLEARPVDLTRITTDAVDDARAVAPARSIDYSPNGAIVVTGDEARLRQVLGNLLQNALRHTPAETPVHVRVTSAPQEAVIEVADEGPGMAPEEAARVFERFWRSDSSRARTTGGTGLGLAIVAAIAEAHGGRAEVETAPDHGATFRVHLPRR